MSWKGILKDDLKHDNIKSIMNNLSENFQKTMDLYTKLDQSIAQENKEMLQVEMGDMALALLDVIKARGNLQRALFRQEELA